MNQLHAQAKHVMLAIAISLAAAACSIGNIHHDDCASNDQCSAAFGAGSTCDKGFCTMSTVDSSCQAKEPDGRACFSASAKCPQSMVSDFENGCTTAQCMAFDPKRLTNLTADGGLPPLP